MPPRSTPPPTRSVHHPPNDPSVYRDLLLFEERLKTNAASLQKRKSRYQLFLLQLLLVIAFLLWEVLMPPQSSLLAIPYNMLLQRLLPDVYRPETPMTLHPYFTSGLLFVSVTTLVLFFASGLYSEKIAYANKYVPHANRALRSFNMYLNVRKPPLRSKFYFNPLSFFFPRPDEQPATRRPESRTSTPRGSRASSPAPSDEESNHFRRRSPSQGKAITISPIPPANNPRGELIFSSKVDKQFRESYERYRSAFERKREEVARQERNARWWGRLMFWRKAPPPVQPHQHTRTTSISGSTSRGRGSRGGTPPNSAIGTPRSSSPSALTRSTGSRSGRMSTPSRSDRSASPGRRRRPLDEQGNTETDMRTIALERSLGLSTT
ncbi:hypothetical protein Moror_5183 [Moniliophthora roreri MCA 2997]|uniref:Transmembrane protein 188 n=1 Tax=Moniliophthora roreri (strain MCA 2997) TaxID=1381753 RepID=V2X9V2_MONRO|nr:hypothetical protein Moror_5183 [Moniliophthora roreri MCA 2997]